MPFSSPAMRSSSRVSSRVSNSQSTRQFAGILKQKDENGKILTSKRIFTDHELIIGRDRSRCHYVINEAVVSNKHIRIYSVVYEKDEPSEIPPLVYAEDLSRNGTYWNGTLIGKGTGGFLLSEGDSLRVSAKTYFCFQRCLTDIDVETFDLIQEREMNHFRKQYVVTDRLLGSGAFGRVFMAIEQMTRTQLACKVVDLRKLKPQSRTRIGRLETPAAAEDVDSRIQLRKVKAWADAQKGDNRLEEKLHTYYREAEILASISHPNIIGLEKVFITDNTIYMFQDLVTAGDLFSYLEHKNGRLLEVEAAVIIRQILVALSFLHDKNIIHRDLKPDNVLMTSLAAGSRIILTDFGAARNVGSTRQRMSSLVGTFGYTAPEIFSRPKLAGADHGYTKAIDMWSLGCLTVLLLTGGLAFVDPVTYEYSEKLASECDLTSLEASSEWQHVRARPKNFVNKLLLLDAERRMSAKDALADSWFSNDHHKTNFEELYQRTIRHWRSRTVKSPVIEFTEADKVMRLACSQEILEGVRKPRRKGQIPVEPPYIPFPRNMHTPLWPKRPPGGHAMSEEVRTAIKEKWTFDDTFDSSGSDNESLPPCSPSSGFSMCLQLRPFKTPSTFGRNTALSVAPRSRSFVPLQPRTPRKQECQSKVHPQSTSAEKVLSTTNAEILMPKGSEASNVSARSRVEIASDRRSAGGPILERPLTSRPKQDSRLNTQLPLRPVTVGESGGEAGATATPENSRDMTDALTSSSGAEDTRAAPRETLVETSAHSLTPNRDSPQDDVGDHSLGSRRASPILSHPAPTIANPGLRMRSHSLRARSQTPLANSKKRRRVSIFDLDEVDDTESKCFGADSKKSRTATPSAKALDTSTGRSSASVNSREQGLYLPRM